MSPNLPVMPSPPIAQPGSGDDQATIDAKVVKAKAYAEMLNSQWQAGYYAQANTLVRELGIHGLILACITGGPDVDNPDSVLGLHKTCAKTIEAYADRLN